MQSTTAPALAVLIGSLQALEPWRVPLDPTAEDFDAGEQHLAAVAKLFDDYIAAVAEVAAENQALAGLDHELLSTTYGGMVAEAVDDLEWLFREGRKHCEGRSTRRYYGSYEDQHRLRPKDVL